MPILDDWESATQLIAMLHAAVRRRWPNTTYLMVDDGSSIDPPVRVTVPGDPVPRVEVLRLRRNLGHQRAIAVGLSHLHAQKAADAVVIMDGDGEDTPEGVVKLLERFEELGGRKIVFAARARRTEGLVFKVLYALFKLLHWILVGRMVKVGNFSVLPAEHLDRLVAVSELWNHYPASTFKARLASETVPVDRGHRIAGESKMNFVGLLGHGLSAISVFADVMGLRLLVAAFVFALLTLGGVATVVTIRFTTTLAIPGWATAATGALIVIFLQAFLMITVFVFITLQGRNVMGFLPIRDHVYFVDKVSRLEVDG
jgi:polyisoprenyl-phosphate glycosyltransferase